jgi:hypothetical protein
MRGGRIRREEGRRGWLAAGRAMPRAILTAALLLGAALTLTADRAEAQRCFGGQLYCFLPLDVGQGPQLGAEGTTPYTGVVRLQALLGVGEGGATRFGASTAAIYTGDSWEAAGGAGISLRLAQVGLQRWGLFATAEQLWGTAGLRPASAGLLADIGLLRLSGRGTRDWNRNVTSLELAVGTGLETLLAILFRGPDDDPRF